METREAPSQINIGDGEAGSSIDDVDASGGLTGNEPALTRLVAKDIAATGAVSR